MDFSRFGPLGPARPNAEQQTQPPPKTRVRFGQSEDRFARVARKEKEETAVIRKAMEPPRLDYRQNFFSPELGEDFLQTEFSTQDSPKITGRELLEFLLTPSSIDCYHPPSNDEDWQKCPPYEQLGQSEANIREFFEQKAKPGTNDDTLSFPLHFYHQVMMAAMRQGLVYQVTDPETKTNYYGIPPHVRETLQLHSAQEIEAVAAEGKTGESEFGSVMKTLAEQVSTLSPEAQDNFMDFLGPAALRAVQHGELGHYDLPEAFRKRADELGLLPANSYIDLLTCMEEAHGTELFESAKTLCDAAAHRGLLDPDEVSQSIQNIS